MWEARNDLLNLIIDFVRFAFPIEIYHPHHPLYLILGFIIVLIFAIFTSE